MSFAVDCRKAIALEFSNSARQFTRRGKAKKRRGDRVTHGTIKILLRFHNDYYLGIFLVGAYQEILGDLHNLFGDTNTVHVQLSPEGEYVVKEVVAGDTVSEVLAFVDYSPSDLLGRLRNSVEAALRKKLMTIEESRTLINRFRQGMIGYTYLDRE